MNKIIIKGRLTRNPESKKLSGTDTTLTRFTVAVDRRMKSRDGKRQADFFNCIAWQKTGELIAQYFTKSAEIIVIGEMQSRAFELAGEKKTAWELIVSEFDFCGSRGLVKKASQDEDILSEEFFPAEDLMLMQE